MKTFNQLVKAYTELLQQKEIQAAYKGILEFIGKLRSDFIGKYPDYEIGSVYQGYMDMSYFPLNTRLLKDHGLKIAVVYLHEKGTFEVWLSAKNRGILKKYKSLLDNKNMGAISVFHDDRNEDAALECTLTAAPDFDNPTSLMETVEQGTERFVATIAKLL